MSSSTRSGKQINTEAGNSSNPPRKQGYKRTKSKSVKRTQEAVNLERLSRCKFVQTRWAHKDTLARLGLLEDVTAIMTNIGIEKMLDMDYLVHEEESAHLIATFELEFNRAIPPNPIEELGCIRFRVKGINYELSLKRLCEAYGFRTAYFGEKKVNNHSDMLIWNEIGHGEWKGSRGKAATIRNPSIRYVHKLLTQTIFARHESDKVKEDELALLAMGIKPFLEDSLSALVVDEVNVGLLLARQIKKIRKEWVPNQNNGSKVYIGGFLNPIFLACEVPLGQPSNDPRSYLDLNTLVRIHFLSGRVEDSLVYNFTTYEGDIARVQLPNLGLTSLLETENVGFRPDSSHFLKEPAAPESPPRTRKGKGIQREDDSRAIPLGSSRYYHPRYEGKATGGVKHALEGVEKNQRKGKWLSKSLHNINASLRKKIKSLEGTVSDLKSIVETFVLRRHSPPRNDDGHMSYEAALEVARRNSISHPLSCEEAGDREGPRASDYERRQRRRRYRHIPTPSPPSSDNELYHLSDSYTEG